MRNMVALCVGMAMLASCSSKSEGPPMEELRTFSTKEDLPTPPKLSMEPPQIVYPAAEAADAAANAADTIDGGSEAGVPTTTPQIAYSYTFGYRLSDGDIGRVQQAHLALCEKMGAARCRIVSMQRESSDGDFVNAALNLVVEAAQAKAFGVALDKAVGDAGGEQTNQAIQAEDLSKQMVDTAARIKAKQALADRLMILLQNRTGKVGELVEAERAFAQAQEELDAARTWMGEMQQRVALSSIEISYQSRTPSGSGLWRPVRDSFASIGQTLGGSIGALVSFVAAALPWVLALAGLIWLVRRLGWLKGARMPWPKRWRRADPDV